MPAADPTIDQLTERWLEARKLLAAATEREIQVRLALNRAVSERQAAAKDELDLFRKINADRDRAGLADVNPPVESPVPAPDKPSGR